MARITTGSAKGRNLKIPNIKNIRVAQDVYKLALFSILGEKVNNAKCLDLYAGSGSFGLEALSRGAGACTFVDQHRAAIDAINENLRACGFTENVTVIQDDAVKFAANAEKGFDIIFVDPFYEDIKHRFLIQNLEEILNDGGVIAFSHGTELNVAETIANTSLEIYTQRRFGSAFLTILKKS